MISMYITIDTFNKAKKKYIVHVTIDDVYLMQKYISKYIIIKKYNFRFLL